MAKAHQLAKKDNDFIYHERIPDFKSLAAVGKAAVAKALPVAKPMSANFKVSGRQKSSYPTLEHRIALVDCEIPQTVVSQHQR